MLACMVQQVSPPIERPVPGHYQGRLTAVLSSLPAGELPPPSLQRDSHTSARRVVIRPQRRRRDGQLALPMESTAAPLRG